MSGPGNAQEMPVFRTMSLKVADRQQITEGISLDYGALMEAVAFIERLNVFSPWARLNYDLGEAGRIEVGFSSGAPATDLLTPASGDNAAQNALLGLAMFPRVSMRDGRARVQNNQTYEIGYRKVDGGRTYAASLYQDSVRNGTVLMSAPLGFFGTADLLPDLASNSSIFNVGSYRSVGYTASVAQSISQHWTASMAVGNSGVLAPVGDINSGGADGVRHNLRPVRRPWATARISGQFPRSGTRLAGAYMWTTHGTLGPAHAWLTQSWQPQLGLNLQVKQPIPAMGGIPGRFEMTAELRNLLAQGYVPLMSPDG
ncbi:MAG: hypothetical protein HZB13_04240 [Acidobacteria bacterium]|nr:hypothetical protein [Acidobacteriota bacterium]